MSEMEKLAGLLVEERRRLEFLLYRLISSQQLLRAGETRFLGWSSAEIERAARRVREVEIARASLVQGLAADRHGTIVHVSLSELAETADPPLRAILLEHRDALRGLVAELDRLRTDNHALAARGLRIVEDVVSLIDASTSEG